MDSNKTPPKAPYTTPKITVYGDIRAITQANSRASSRSDNADNSGRLKT